MNRDEHVERIGRDGWSVIEGVIPDYEIEAIKDQVSQSTQQYGRTQAGAKGIGHVPGFLRYDQSYAPYLANEKLMSVLEALLGPFVKVSFTTATINRPGNERGGWHADWPFNQRNAGHVPAPYPDAIMHVTTLWMLSPFTKENGGTLIVPGSHRWPDNPTGGVDHDPLLPYPSEINATGPAGSVLVLDSRIWHSTAANCSNDERVSVVVRYAPWWLNTRVLMPGSEERKMMVDETGGFDNDQELVPRAIYNDLPEDVKPLFRHWVEQDEP